MYKIEPAAKCVVIGYGSWATALVKILLESEAKVGWYISKPEVAEYIGKEHKNPRYLQDVKFDADKLELSTDINRSVEWADIVILAVPSVFLKPTLEPLTVSLKDKFIISAIKGIIPIPGEEYLTIAEYANRKYNIPYGQIGIVTGPCHSEEVAFERLSYLTMVCKDIDNARTLCTKFENKYIRTNPSTDIYGAEYAAALKNVYAIAAGISVGVGYGDNFLAVLIANAAMEMTRFIEESYPAQRESTQSAYLGDLLVTCYSQFSRNRMFGTMIGRGHSVKATMNQMSMVAEGYYASECVMQMNKQYRIELPIADCVHNILYGGKPAAAEINKLTTKLL